MSKTATYSTLPVYSLATGNAIDSEDAQTIIESLNYAFQETNCVHVSLISGPADWDTHGGDDEMGTHNVYFPASSGATEFYAFRIYVGLDVQEIKVGAKCHFETSNEGDVIFTVGGATPVTLSFTSASSLEQTDTVDTADTGSGWIDVLIELDHTLGGSAINTLDSWRVENNPCPVLPDPVLE